jgi:hypothetical protein
MLKSLLASSSLSLALLFMPIGTDGPIQAPGISGPAAAFAAQAKKKATAGIDVDLGFDDDDDDCDDDDCDDDDD